MDQSEHSYNSAMESMDDDASDKIHITLKKKLGYCKVIVVGQRGNKELLY